MAKAQFIGFYGAAEYRGQHWATRDHVIPFHLFWRQYRAMRHARALERIHMARAITLGLAMAMGKEDVAARHLKETMMEAFPEA